MKLGVIADDFTGASDIALTLAEGGMQVAQHIGVPRAQATEDYQAAVIALKSRTAPVSDAVSQSLAACDWLLEQGAQQIVFKVCSTFDSTSEGNIGPVLDALAARLDAKHVLVCPAFPENGRSVYQGHLFVNDVLLNKSGMQDHPLTPMHDADLRNVLASQTHTKVDHVPQSVVKKGAAVICEALRGDHRELVIIDAISDKDLREIGQAAKSHPLICGGSGIAIGLPENFGCTSQTPDWEPIEGPGVVISGSCSRATRAQVERFKQDHPALEITAETAISGSLGPTELADWVMDQKMPALVYSSADPEVVRAAQKEYGLDATAEAIEALFANTARELAKRGVRRFVVAGGETSGAVTQGLGVDTFQIGPRISAGVPLLRIAGRPMALALKSGNFGDENFFSRALDLMERGND